VDGAGNVYAAGTFYGTVDFDPGPGTESRIATNTDAYVAKYDPDGSLLWVGAVQGPQYESAADIAVDENGNVYLAGSFSGDPDFDPDPAVIHSLTNAGKTDAFVLKFKPDGDLVWARSFGGPENDYPYDVEDDRFGHTWVAGSFEGTADFNPGPGASVYPLTSNGSQDAFVLKLNPDGNFIWAVQAGGAADDRAGGLDVDRFGRGIVTGQYRGTVDFDPGPADASLTSTGTSPDAFVWKVNADGSHLWAKGIGGDSPSAGVRVTVDDTGDVVAAGGFEGTIDADPGPGTTSLTSEGADDAFVVKLDGSGALSWAGRMGGTGIDTPYGLVADPSGDVYVAGHFEGTADFDPGPEIVALTSAGSFDAFVVRLGPDGSLDEARRFGGAASDSVWGLAVDADGFAYLGGGFAGTVDFDLGLQTIGLSSDGPERDGFVAKLDLTGPEISIVTPADGSQYPIWQPLAASYSCTDAGVGVGTCLGAVRDVSAGEPTGTVANGGAIDTTRLGVFEFSVTATDLAGNATTLTHTYGIFDSCGESGEMVTIAGTQDDDVLKGTAGDDVIAGYGGDDVILGYGGNDIVCGGPGNDDIRGGPGIDELRGDDGNDRLRGAAGNDLLHGGAGSDRLIPEFGNDSLDGGPGSDIVDYLAASGPVDVDLPGGVAYYRPDEITTWTHALSRVEKADGTRYDDILIGDGKRNVLRGKHGSDEIHGGDGNDDVIGGLDDDEIHGNEGDDLVKGQGDDDSLRGDDGSDRLVGGSGNDTLRGGPGDDVLIGGLKIHFGTYTNLIDGQAGTDTCRWAHDEPANCEP
jgi:Ca2+-binding RTX toxin-like protein